MKIQLTILLALFCLCASTQISWTELEPFNKEALQIIHATKQNKLIGFLEETEKIYSSCDAGETWDLIYSGIIISNHQDPIIRANDNDELFVLHEDALQRINEEEELLEFIFKLDSSIRPDDFFFADDGNLIFLDHDELHRYDKNGQILNSRKFGESVSARTLLQGESDLHVAAGYYSLIRFNDDLSTVEEFSYQDGTIFNLGLDIHDGIIYAGTRFSSDWTNWTIYPDSVWGKLTVTNAGKIHLTNEEFTFISDDGGESFQKFPSIYPEIEPFNSESFALFETGVLYVRDDNYPQTTFAYSLDGESPCIVAHDKLEIGLPYATVVQVASSANIFARDRKDAFFKHQNTTDWQVFDDSPQGICRPDVRTMISLENGLIIDRRGCISFDEGRSWRMLSNVGSADRWILKDDVLYSIGFDEIQKTYDHGITWEKVGWNGPFGRINDSNTTISREKSLFTIDPSDSGILIKYSLTGLRIQGYVPPSQFSTFKEIRSSYRGSDIYGLVSGINQAEAWLMVMTEDGDKVEYRPIDLGQNEIDYTLSLDIDVSDNIYVYSNKFILMSSDEGMTWINITPDHPDLHSIEDIDIGWDGHIYVASIGTPILKSAEPVFKGQNELNVILYSEILQNCELDNNEDHLEGIKVEIENAAVRRSDHHGLSRFFLPQGEFQLKINLRDDLYQACPFDSSIKFSDYGVVDTIRIGVDILKECADLNLSSTIPILRRCFDNSYFFEVANYGSATAENVIIEVELDEFFEFKSCNFPAQEIRDNIYSIELGDIPINTVLRGSIEFKLSCEAELGQAHYSTAEIYYGNHCNTLLDTIEVLECRENIGSFDPNDKSSYINGIHREEIIGKDRSIEYLIRFQNTGTDTAFNVRIEDPLHPAFDITTLQPLVASHDFNYRQDKNNLVINFDNILLPDSTKNEKKSHGFIKFRVELNPSTVSPGDQIRNTALIYFDFNDPVITNTTTNYYLCKDQSVAVDTIICEGESYAGYSISGTYSETSTTLLGCDSLTTINLTVLGANHVDCSISSASDLSILPNMRLYPNPAIDKVSVLNAESSEIESYTVMSLEGKSVNGGNYDGLIDVSGLSEGIYLVILYLEDGRENLCKLMVN